MHQCIGIGPLQGQTFSSNESLRTGLRIYIYALPFTYALSLADGRVTLSLLISAGLALILTFRLLSEAVAIPNLKACFPFLLFLTFLFFLPLGQLFTGTVTGKSLNHFLAYGVSIVGFGLIPMLAVANMRSLGWATVLLRDIMWTARIAALAAVLQFIFSNFWGVFFEDIIYYPNIIEDRSMFLGLFFRSRGFAAEPGHYAFTLELLAPLLLYGHSVSQSKSRLIIITDLLLLMIAFLSTGSPAALLIIVSGLVIAALLFPPRHVTAWLWFVVIALVMTVGLINVIAENIAHLNWLDLLSSLFTDKLDSTSASVRAERINVGLNLIVEASPLQLLLGYGPAVYEAQNLGEESIIQFYLLLILEGGLIGTLLFLGGFALLAANAIKQLGQVRFFYFWAFLNLALHYCFISNYYYPMIWFMFPLLLIMETVDIKQ
jgi:hypothetical protein